MFLHVLLAQFHSGTESGLYNWPRQKFEHNRNFGPYFILLPYNQGQYTKASNLGLSHRKGQGMCIFAVPVFLDARIL